MQLQNVFNYRPELLPCDGNKYAELHQKSILKLPPKVVEHPGSNNKIADLSFSYHDKVGPSEDARHFLSVKKGSPDGRKNCKKSERNMYTAAIYIAMDYLSFRVSGALSRSAVLKYY